MWEVSSTWEFGSLNDKLNYDLFICEIGLEDLLIGWLNWKKLKLEMFGGKWSCGNLNVELSKGESAWRNIGTAEK
ncbi:MAG: hypothetical protein ACTS6G_01455 [Candidatus Hodgkinia cicadicola]